MRQLLAANPHSNDVPTGRSWHCTFSHFLSNHRHTSILCLPALRRQWRRKSDLRLCSIHRFSKKMKIARGLGFYQLKVALILTSSASLREYFTQFYKAILRNIFASKFEFRRHWNGLAFVGNIVYPHGLGHDSCSVEPWAILGLDGDPAAFYAAFAPRRRCKWMQTTARQL